VRRESTGWLSRPNPGSFGHHWEIGRQADEWPAALRRRSVAGSASRRSSASTESIVGVLVRMTIDYRLPARQTERAGSGRPRPAPIAAKCRRPFIRLPSNLPVMPKDPGFGRDANRGLSATGRPLGARSDGAPTDGIRILHHESIAPSSHRRVSRRQPRTPRRIPPVADRSPVVAVDAVEFNSTERVLVEAIAAARS